MSDAFVNGFIITLGNRLSESDTKLVREALSAYSMGYDITPVKTALVTVNYELPMEYKMFMVSKRQDGRMRGNSAYIYAGVLEPLLYGLKLPLEQITTNHIRAYLFRRNTNQKTGEELSPYTRNLYKTIIKSFFTWLYENRYISENPTLVLKMEKTSSVKEREPFSEEEVERIRLACKNERERAIVEMLLATGVRIEELCSIKKDDVDFTNREIHVLGKERKWRTVYFSQRAALYLKRYYDKRKDDSPYMIGKKRGDMNKPCDPGGIRKVCDAIGERAGIDIFPHRFRHTFASRLEKGGCPMEVIQELLGHTKIDTTRRYVAVEKSKVRAEYDRFTA